jgi:hypothetical protein
MCAYLNCQQLQKLGSAGTAISRSQHSQWASGWDRDETLLTLLGIYKD